MAGHFPRKYNFALVSVCQSLVLTAVLMLSLANGSIIMSSSSKPSESSGIPSGNQQKTNNNNVSLFDPTIQDCKYLYQAENVETFKHANRSSTVFVTGCATISNESFALDLTKDGYLLMDSNNNSAITYYPPTQFCAASKNTAKMCQSHVAPVPVWRKCCAEHQMLSQTSPKSCINSTVMRFRPKVHGELYPFTVRNSKGSSSGGGVVNLSCPAGYYLKKLSSNSCSSSTSITRKSQSIFSWFWNFDEKESNPEEASLHNHHHCNHCKFRLLQNGSISYEEATGIFYRKGKWKTIQPGDDLYCIDGVINPFSISEHNWNSHKQHNSVVQSSHFTSAATANSYRSLSNNNIENVRRRDNDDGKKNDQQNKPLSDVSTFVAMYICLPYDDDALDEINNNKNVGTKTILLAVLWIITCPLLFGAALGNLLMIQRNVHGWLLSCYLLSMCLLNVLSIIVILNVGRASETANNGDIDNGDDHSQSQQQSPKEEIESSGGGEIDNSGCYPIDFAIKFIYMSTLCWMTSINFGLWKTFRYTLPRPAGIRRFIMSVLFSLGFPFLSVTVAYGMAYLNSAQDGCESEYCLLFSFSTIPFFTVPLFLLVFVNFAIFLKTSWRIASLRQEAAEILQRQAQDHLKSFTLFTKLFLLTGSIWLIRLVLFILQINGLYLSWYGILLEMTFSIPEIVFPLIVFHHPEFIKWSWSKAPKVSSLIVKFNPFFKTPTGSKQPVHFSFRM